MLTEPLELFYSEASGLPYSLRYALDYYKVNWVSRDFEHTSPHCKVEEDVQQVPNMRFAFRGQRQLPQPKLYKPGLYFADEFVAPMRQNIIV